MSDTITKCFDIIEERFGRGGKWVSNKKSQSISENQEKFLKSYYSCIDDLSKFSNEELYGMSTEKIEEANKYLLDHGFKIQLKIAEDPEDDKGMISVVSILNINSGWDVTSSKAGVINEYENCEDARSIKGSIESVDIVGFTDYKMKDSDDIVSGLKLKNGDLLYITERKDKPEDFVCKFNETKYEVDLYDRIIFPAVEFHEEEDLIDLFGGLCYTTSSNFWFIIQALQEINFGMNYEGVIIKMANAFVGFSGCAEGWNQRIRYIKDAFLIWIVRPDTQNPYFIKNIEKKDFKPFEWQKP